MGENVNFIYVNNKKVELKQSGENVSKESIKNDSAKMSIFNKLNKANANGKKDNVLNEKELSDFEKKLRQYAGKDNNLSIAEARKMLNDMGLKNVSTNKLFEFIGFTYSNDNITYPPPRIIKISTTLHCQRKFGENTISHRIAKRNEKF